MQSIIQILKLNDLRTGVKDGRQWEMQDAECLLLTPEGAVDQVGVLRVPKEMRGQAVPGTYLGSFALRPDRERRIQAVLTGLQPYEIRKVLPAKAA